MRDVERLQAVFDEFGDPPGLRGRLSDRDPGRERRPLREIHASGRCEIGAHLHPWVSPPFDEEVNARNSYPGNLPRELERKKLAELVDAIEARPRRAAAPLQGRTLRLRPEHGGDARGARLRGRSLAARPPFDYGADGGPDFSRASAAEPSLARPRDRAPARDPDARARYVGFLSRLATERLRRLAQAHGRPLLRWRAAPGASLARCARRRAPAALARGLTHPSTTAA